MKKTGIVDEAAIFAVNAHSGKFRKGENRIPYIVHPMEAAAIVASMTNDPEIIAAALLHDTIEDADITEEALALRFGERVAKLVQAVTEKREEKATAKNWTERKKATIEALNAETDLAVKMIVIGDKLSNLRTTYVDYLSSGDEVWKRFNREDPLDHAWYYRSIAQATNDLEDYPAWVEYNDLIDKVFSAH